MQKETNKPKKNNDLTSWMRKNNRAARATRTLVEFFDVFWHSSSLRPRKYIRLWNRSFYWIMCNKDLCRSTLSADMSILGRHVGRLSVDISAESVGRHVGRLSVDISADSVGRHHGRYVAIDCRWCIGRLSVYRSIVHRCFAEIAAISLPRGEQENTHKKYAQDYRIQRKSCIGKV